MRRTATVLVSAPKTFFAIGLLAAIPAVASVAIPQPTATGTVDGGYLIMTIGLALLGALWSVVIGTVTVVATAQIATFQRPRLVEVFSDLDRPVTKAVLAGLTLFLLWVLGSAAFIVAIAALGLLGLWPLAAFLVPAGVVVGAIAFLRVSLVLPAIVLETRGARDAIWRSWDVTHRLTWHLLGFFLASGLLVGLPVIAVQSATLLAPSPLIRIAAALLTGPAGILITIASTILFGHLIGRPWNLPDRVPRAVALVTSISILSFLAIGVVASIVVAQTPFFLYMTDRSAGQVEFGRSPAPAGTCHVGGRASSFGPDDPVYVSAVFLLPVGNGLPVMRELSRNGVVVSSAPVSVRQITSCYIEQAPLQNLAAGAYRLTFRQQRFVIADGQFVLQGGTSTQTSRAADRQPPD